MIIYHIRLYFTCLAFLSRLPIPASWQDFDSDKITKIPNYFWASGLTLGIINAFIALILCFILPANLAIAALIPLQIIIAGAFHEDGFADLADSMGGYTRERRFEIMRDSRLGTFGVCAIGTILLIRYQSFLHIAEQHETNILIWMLILSASWSRWTSITFINFLPYLHPSGKGIAKGFEPANRINTLTGLVLLVVLSFTLGWKGSLGFLLTTTIVTILAYLFFKKIFGGINGDCLGAITISHELLSLILISSIL